MPEEMWEKANQFFQNLATSSEARQELKRYNRVIEFEVTDGDSFSVQISNGTVKVVRGISKPTDPGAIHFIGSKSVVLDLFRAKKRFTDVYIAQKTKDGKVPDSKLFIQESSQVAAGGTGGPLAWWTGKLIRMAQELR